MIRDGLISEESGYSIERQAQDAIFLAAGGSGGRPRRDQCSPGNFRFRPEKRSEALVMGGSPALDLHGDDLVSYTHQVVHLGRGRALFTHPVAKFPATVRWAVRDDLLTHKRKAQQKAPSPFPVPISPRNPESGIRQNAPSPFLSPFSPSPFSLTI